LCVSGARRTLGNDGDFHVAAEASRLFHEVATERQPPCGAARNLSLDAVKRVIAAHSEHRGVGFWGEPRVNVLLTNVALDRQFGSRLAGAK
jgi:K+-transporting ATPase c subunit